MSWFRGRSRRPSPPPPQWTSAPESSHTYGLLNEAPAEDCERAEKFCQVNTPETARLLPSSDIDRIATEKCAAWGLELLHTDDSYRETFKGEIHNQTKSRGTGVATKVVSYATCKDCCLFSNLPLMASLYYRPQDGGVYFELTIQEMQGIIAIGTTCRPYPHYRLPGWHRLSAALHLDDMCKFYENPDGGQDSGFCGGRSPGIGDTIGCGYEFTAGGTMFFTFNGERLVPDAFKGLYLRDGHDVYAAIGIDGENEFTVNFGGDFFMWQPANEWSWRLNRHVGQLSAPPAPIFEELPAYTLRPSQS
ncbi:hypothetical protein HYDPIDRAFT_90298 [Hydnomerulius pinastri MD-312]|uniref:SPRY domain-containing protein n=1 Tax=Hydnomerulius pinastri MD-312 TaxID=994086 RepID=A0A0C9WF84_9AGAM|nr:hypothetical protein HYDPIDRAFT_90298 [Hydnomerulius pinastri MD-312]